MNRYWLYLKPALSTFQPLCQRCCWCPPHHCLSPGDVGVLLLPVSLWSWVLLLVSVVCWVPNSWVLPRGRVEEEPGSLAPHPIWGFQACKCCLHGWGCWDHRHHCSRGAGVKCATSAAATVFIWGVGTTAGMRWGRGWNCGYLCCYYWAC